MYNVDIVRGSYYVHWDRLYRIERVIDSEKVLVENCSTGTTHELEISMLRRDEYDCIVGITQVADFPIGVA